MLSDQIIYRGLDEDVVEVLILVLMEYALWQPCLYGEPPVGYVAS